MVQQKSLEAHQLKTYTTFLKFFQESIGIVQPLREAVPHKEILVELKFTKKKGFNEVGKGIIAKHALLSFFPPQLRNNSLLLLYLYKKLIIGETPLTNRSIAALSRYYESRKPILEENIKRHSDLAERMLTAINIMLPETQVDYYFNNYLKRLIFWNDTLLEDDYNILDAIMDDFWISNNWKYSSEEVYMILTISQLFNSNKIPFSPGFFQDYVTNNRDTLLEKYGPCKWILDEIELSTIWRKFTSQGINFSYSINSGKIGLVPVNFVLQMHPKTDNQIMRFFLELVGNNYYMFENWSQNDLIIFGLIYVPDVDIEEISSFFGRLKNIGAVKDYLLISGKMNYRGFSQFLYGVQNQEDSKSSILWQKEDNNEIVKVDAFDLLFLQCLRQIGFTGFPLDDISKFSKDIISQIESRLSSLQTQLNQLRTADSNLQNYTDNLQTIIPNCYYTSEIKTFDDYLQNTNLSIIENLFFFEKWHQILSLVSNFKSRNDLSGFYSLKTKNPTLFINIRNEMRTIKKFVITIYKSLNKTLRSKQAYSTKKLLNNLIQDDNTVDVLSPLVSDINSMILLLKTRLNSITYDTDSFSNQISQLQTISQLSDKEISAKIQDRLKFYMDNSIIVPNLMYSVILEHLGLFNCSFFNKKIPYEAREILSRKVRKMFFSITGNFLENWDIDYGEIKLDKIKNHWLISQKLNFQNASFIQTPYNAFYNYDDLYDFSNREFPSIKSMMKRVLNFCAKHLNHPKINEKHQFTAYLEEDGLPPNDLEGKGIKSLDKYLKPHLLNSEKEYCADIDNVTRIFQEAQVKNTTIFLSPENTSMKEIQAEINWPRIGLEEYIVSFKVKKDSFTHKSLPHPVNTREFLCVPGIKEIYCTSDTGYFQNTFIHYIFPFNSPPYNVFHSLERWNYIENLQIMRIKTKKICFNDQFLDNNAIGYKAWELAGHRIITGSMKEYDVDPITFEYNPGQKILGPNSPQFHTLKTIYGKNIRRLKNIPIFEKIDKLFNSNIIWYTPRMDQLYQLPLRLIIQLYPLSHQQLKIFKLLFMAVPVSIQYLVDIEEDNTFHEGLFVDLRFHKSNLSELLCALQNVVHYLKIKNFKVIPSIIPITKQEFVGYKLKNYPNLFKSFIWDKNHFRNIRFLSQTGPLSFNERYKQLK